MSGVRVSLTGIIAIGVKFAGVKPGTVRVWITRGLITEYPDGFDPDELIQWVETTRDVRQARYAAIAAHTRYQTRRSDGLAS